MVLELLAGKLSKAQILVSIPVRDLVVLERFSLASTSQRVCSFNPCEGFGGFGTEIEPCQYPCLYHVSIPVRDLVVLEH